MRYVTETELREAYAKGMLDSFELDGTVRLTPGARQFLIDFHIPMIDLSQKAKSGAKAEPRAVSSSISTGELQAEASVMGAKMRLCAKHAEGICNGLAKVLEDAGLRLLRFDFDQLAEDVDPVLAPVTFVPVAQAVHALYFELSLLDAELFQSQTFVLSEAKADDAYAKRYVVALASVRASIAAALTKCVEEVSHG